MIVFLVKFILIFFSLYRDIPGKVVQGHVHHHIGVLQPKIVNVFLKQMNFVNKIQMKIIMKIIINVDVLKKKNLKIISINEKIDIHVDRKDEEMIIGKLNQHLDLNINENLQVQINNDQLIINTRKMMHQLLLKIVLYHHIVILHGLVHHYQQMIKVKRKILDHIVVVILHHQQLINIKLKSLDHVNNHYHMVVIVIQKVLRLRQHELALHHR